MSPWITEAFMQPSDREDEVPGDSRSANKGAKADL